MPKGKRNPPGGQKAQKISSIRRFIGRQSRERDRETASRIFCLKCDIKKYFASIDHEILFSIIKKKIKDDKILEIIKKIIDSSFDNIEYENLFEYRKTGVPIGNLTSQLFANVYMNELDQFVKHELKIKNYARYTDDFVVVGDSREFLLEILRPISRFLKEKLALDLHPRKVIVRKCSQGVDFLGYVELPYHRKVRTKTKKRIFKKMRQRVAEYEAGARSEESMNQCLQSYLGVLSHADTYELKEELLNQIWFWRN